MELKSYQQKVIDDLELFLEYVQKHKDYAKAFDTYWEDRIGPYNAIDGSGMPLYKNHVPKAVHVCMNVPTAGGKTFIACNALSSIFNAFDSGMPKVVVWLVPWSNLLDQTVDNLSNAEHPYRQRLNTLFNHRVEVYRKKDVESGAGFSPDTVQEQLSIIVMSFASLRARNKEDRKVFQENGNLMGFANRYKDRSVLLDDVDDTALMNVIRSLDPVIVLDESHNAESKLSIEMLNNLNPSFILDLTATPKENSNIVSMVPAIELKKEHMVKLPVIVYNHNDRTEVISSAIHLRKKLEVLAIKEHETGGKYIRPIVLFQAQSNTGADKTTFEKLKKQLLACGIPEAEIKIKTANINELKGIDLMAEDCEVRFIITINALKEGWDCPFAYVLASLADKSSAVDVEQILGRVLRQPYVKKHGGTMLNLSYVLTASSKFNETLQNIVHSLQEAGFSGKDYREIDGRTEETKTVSNADPMVEFLFPEQQVTSVDDTDEIDVSRVVYSTASESGKVEEPSFLEEISTSAKEQNVEMEAEIERQKELPPDENLFEAMGEKVKRYAMLPANKELASSIVLPRFYLKTPTGDIFNTGEVPLSRESLLKNFKLSQEATKIDFERVSSDLYKVDIEELQANESAPRYVKIEDDLIKDKIIDIILAKPQEDQVKDIAHQIILLVGNMFPIADPEIRLYIERILDNLSPEQLSDALVRKLSYAKRIKEQIRLLADTHAEEQFQEAVTLGNIHTKDVWSFSDRIVPGRTGASISNSLYEKE
ncbi:MAG: DEAD/DEAH box helicase family protein, partial [Flavobacteriales bacterium]|nr:DEAD/DEAH box helicase family protein [Flavobacteriales bacterium]